MLTPQQIEALNSKISTLNYKNFTVEEQDRAIRWGNDAEQLLDNNSFAVFITSFKLDVVDELSNISSYTDELNNKRLALSNQISGIDRFVESLKSSVALKNRLVTIQKGSVAPDQN